MKKDFLNAMGNASLVVIVVAAVCTALNVLCIWLGYIGLVMSLAAVTCFLLLAWDNIATATKASYATYTILLSAFYMLSVVLCAWFIPAVIAVGLLCVLMRYLKCIDVDVFVLMVTSYVLGLEFSFILMGDEIPASEMKFEYLAIATVGVIWLLTCIQTARGKKCI